MNRPRRAGPLALSWRVRGRSGLTVVRFFGEIDETADFSELLRRLGPRALLHLGEVRRLDSRGALSWVRFMRDLARHEVILTHCSPAFVSWLNVVEDFAGRAQVRSLLAPYRSPTCGRSEVRLVDLKTQLAGKPAGYTPPFTCDGCGELLELDDLPERYFSFLFP